MNIKSQIRPRVPHENHMFAPQNPTTCLGPFPSDKTPGSAGVKGILSLENKENYM